MKMQKFEVKMYHQQLYTGEQTILIDNFDNFVINNYHLRNN